MINAIILYLNDWNVSKNERQKLQHTLLALTFAIVFGAGIISLINADLGHSIVLVALFTLAAFFANAVIWNILQSSVISKLSTKSRRK